LGLYFLCHCIDLRSLSIIFGVSEATGTRYLWMCMKILDKILPDPEFPDDNKLKDYSRAVNSKYPTLTNVVGFLDGLRLKTEMSTDFATQKRHYSGFKRNHNALSLFVWNPRGEIMAYAINYDGHKNDSGVFAESRLGDFVHSM